MNALENAVLYWIVWPIARRAIKREIRENRVKIGAAAVVGLVLVGGVLAARSGSDAD